MLNPLINLLYATNLAYGSSAAMFGANQARMALANSVTGEEAPSGLAALARHDQALTFQGIQAYTNYQVAQAMQQNARMQLKKHEEERRRLMEAGATLV
jgi:hypothetical protein